MPNLAVTCTTSPQQPVLVPGCLPEPGEVRQAARGPERDPAHRHPAGVVPGFQNFTGPAPPDMLRLKVAVPPSAPPNSLGLVARDAAGFPNGRRVTDDVTTIELRAIAGLTIPLVDQLRVPRRFPLPRAPQRWLPHDPRRLGRVMSASHTHDEVHGRTPGPVPARCCSTSAVTYELFEEGTDRARLAVQVRGRSRHGGLLALLGGPHVAGTRAPGGAGDAVGVVVLPPLARSLGGLTRELRGVVPVDRVDQSTARFGPPRPARRGVPSESSVIEPSGRECACSCRFSRVRSPTPGR